MNMLYYLIPIAGAIFNGIMTALTRRLKRLDTEYSVFWIVMSLVILSTPLEIVQLATGEPLIPMLT